MVENQRERQSQAQEQLSLHVLLSNMMTEGVGALLNRLVPLHFAIADVDNPMGV